MRTMLLLGAGLGLALVVSAPAQAKQPKQEKEKDALKRAIKNQKKLKSYQTDAYVVGGITRGENPKQFSRSLATVDR